MSRVKARTIFAVNIGKDHLSLNSLSFGIEIVVDAFVKPFIPSRNLNGLQSTIIQKMEFVFGLEGARDNY